MTAPAEVRIRTATEADLPALVRLLAALFSIEKDFRPDPQRQLFGLRLLLADRRRCAVLVADRSGDVIGMVTGQLVVSTAEGGPSVLVEDLVVDEGARRGGVGAALARELERWATERGATRLQLLADEGNAPALAFYARVGWARTRLVALRRGGT
jgi:ribosomal protein S18 acetylase RimI-like enzyme